MPLGQASPGGGRASACGLRDGRERVARRRLARRAAFFLTAAGSRGGQRAFAAPFLGARARPCQTWASWRASSARLRLASRLESRGRRASATAAEWPNVPHGLVVVLRSEPRDKKIGIRIFCQSAGRVAKHRASASNPSLLRPGNLAPVSNPPVSQVGRLLLLRDAHSSVTQAGQTGAFVQVPHARG